MISISELQKISTVSFDKAVHNLLQLIRDLSFPDAEDDMKDMMAALFLVSHCFTLESYEFCPHDFLMKLGCMGTYGHSWV